MAKKCHSKNKKQEAAKNRKVESTEGELYVALRRFFAQKIVDSLQPKKCHSEKNKEKVAKKERCSHKDRYIRLGYKKRPRCRCYLRGLKRHRRMLNEAEKQEVSLMTAEERVKFGFPMM